MQTTALQGGFDAPPQQSALAFRQIMEAMARPGLIRKITGAVPPAPLSEAAATVVLTLCDTETPVYLAGAHDTPEVRQWIAFHTGAPFHGPDRAAFALGTWDALAPLHAYPIGTPEFPDRSTTLIVEMPALTRTGATLKGPGIKHEITLSLPDRAAFQINAAQFPLGLDFILTSGAQLAAVPRSTKVL
jgi:alpha-D-ribose 1-methylphosphonate 5-triphosphate synthase subunit PhnH